MNAHKKFTQCEALRIGRRISELQRQEDVIVGPIYGDREKTPRGNFAGTIADAAYDNLRDEIDCLSDQLCFVNAETIEGTMYQALCLFRRDPLDLEEGFARVQRSRMNDRLLVSMIQFLSSHAEAGKVDLSKDCSAPSRDVNAVIAEIFEYATKRTAERKQKPKSADKGA